MLFKEAIEYLGKNKFICKFKKLYPDSKEPFQKSAFDAGYDLFTRKIEDFGDHIKAYTGVAIQPDQRFWFMLCPRSSAHKNGLIMYNGMGIIDNNFTGELVGIFYKTENFTMPQVGDRLVQLIPQELVKVDFKEVEEFEETDRGDRGLGSSGR